MACLGCGPSVNTSHGRQRRRVTCLDSVRTTGGRPTTVSMHGTGVDVRPSGEACSARVFRSVPRDGDVLASKRTARADFYTISIVPEAEHIRAGRHSEAMDKVQELAEQLGVDGWFTCDHTHFVSVATHRTGRPTSQADETGAGPHSSNRRFRIDQRLRR